MFCNKTCGWPDWNRGPQVSEVTTKPTEPQPLPPFWTKWPLWSRLLASEVLFRFQWYVIRIYFIFSNNSIWLERTFVAFVTFGKVWLNFLFCQRLSRMCNDEKIKNIFLSPSKVYFWMGQPRPLFRWILFFSNTNFTEKTVGFSGIWTWIVRVEGEHTDHLTTSAAPKVNISSQQ